MHHTFRPSGVCSVFIEFDIDDGGRLRNVEFKGGCDGNLKAIGKLVEGRETRRKPPPCWKGIPAGLKERPARISSRRR